MNGNIFLSTTSSHNLLTQSISGVEQREDTLAQSNLHHGVNPNVTKLPPPIISDEAYHIIYLASIVLLAITSTFGIIVNILNIIVYKRHGLKESIILGFFALSISDLILLISLLGIVIAATTAILLPNTPIDFIGIQSITIGNVREMAFFYSNVLTALLSLERSCCVMFPFHVKLIFTRRRSRNLIIGLFVFVIVGFAPVFASTHIRWITIPFTNGTRILTLWAPPYRKQIYDFSFILMGIPIPTIALVLVICNTAIMIVGLRASSKFRKATAGGGDSLSSRDSHLVKVMVFVGSILTICNLPYIVFLYAMYFEPRLDFGRQYQNTFSSAYAVCYFLSSVNASANIFVYYKNSSRFRQIFDETFGGLTGKKLTQSGEETKKTGSTNPSNS